MFFGALTTPVFTIFFSWCAEILVFSLLLGALQQNHCEDLFDIHAVKEGNWEGSWQGSCACEWRQKKERIQMRILGASLYVCWETLKGPAAYNWFSVAVQPCVFCQECQVRAHAKGNPFFFSSYTYSSFAPHKVKSLLKLSQRPEQKKNKSQSYIKNAASTFSQ